MENGRKVPFTLTRNQLVGYIISLSTLPVLFVFACLGQPDQGFAVAVLLGIFGYVAYIKKHLWRNAFFIAALFILFLAQLFLVMQLPLAKIHLTRIIVFPIAALDLILLLVIARLIEKFLGSAGPKHDDR